jgi:hypothetical protein
MRQLFIFIIVILNLSSSLAAQPLSGYSSRENDVFVFLNNAALLPGATSVSAGIFYERPYMVEGINKVAAAILFPLKQSGFGLSLKRTGSAEFNHSIMGLSYGRKLSPKINLGAEFAYNSQKIKGYHTKSGLSYGLGVVIYPVEKLNAGCYFEKSVSQLNYCFGFGFDASEFVLLSCIIMKETNKTATVDAFISYRPVKSIVVKGGITLDSFMTWISAGCEVRRIRVEVLSRYHQQLGFSPGLSLQLPLKKN